MTGSGSLLGWIRHQLLSWGDILPVPVEQQRASEKPAEVQAPLAPQPAPLNPSPQQQVRQLIKQALENPTADEFIQLLDFSHRFRRMAVWNARMAQIQRPGAAAIASEFEWQSVGRYVVPDAVPIIILWPFSPVKFVYELSDTGPPIDRDKIGDLFAVKGSFEGKMLSKLIAMLAEQKTFRIKVEVTREGFHRAGSAAGQGTLPSMAPPSLSTDGTSPIGDFASANARSAAQTQAGRIPVYRIRLNDRMTEAERFVTLAHELAHIFCGHLGPCQSKSGGTDEESGWPDRRRLATAEREVEAEAVAFLIASRAGLVSASAAYIAPHAKKADMSQVDVDLITRAAARIERLAKISHGTMRFKAEPKKEGKD
jgi:hypothetical protein